MSNLIINWRFGRWFFQVTRPSDWGHTVGSPVTLKRYPSPRPGVALYQGRRYFVGLVVLLGVILWAVL